MLRPFGALLVFLGCSAVGFTAASELKREQDLLRAFTASLALLRFEIGYRARSLPEIFSKASQSAPEPLSGFFCRLAGTVSESPGENLSAHIKASLLSSGTLPKPICEALEYLGGSLGGTDTETQLHTISLCENMISTAERELHQEFCQRGRARRTLGVCAGAVLAILFL